MATSLLAIASLFVGMLQPTLANDSPRVLFRGQVAPEATDGSALDDVFWLMKGSERRQPALEALLRPMFDVLPLVKTSNTNEPLLGPNSLRYALHRVFVTLHGWQIRGLEPNAKAKPGFELSETSVVHGWLQAFLDHRHGEGMSLSELAALGAMIEEHVHQQFTDRIQNFWEHYADKDGLISEKLLAYAITMIKSPVNDTETNEILTKASEIIDKLIDLSKDSDEWEEAKFYVWLRDMQFGLANTERHSLNPFKPGLFNLDFLGRVIDDIGDGHGKWQNMECKTVKDFLIELDPQGLGRVPLRDFYKAQLDGRVPSPFRFIESEAYLKHLGALDDSNPRRPSLMVPNYINARSNCISSKNSYEVCCIDECEALLGQVEAHIQASSATPEEIVAVVSKIPSETNPAPRVLSSSLVARLNETATGSDGRVSLHSRLFAQWLHYAYPYECAYPHPLTGDDDMLQTADAWLETDTAMSAAHLHEAVSLISERHAEADKVDGGRKISLSDIAWSSQELSFTEEDDDAVAAAARQHFARKAQKKGRSGASSLPAKLVLVSAAVSFFIWVFQTVSRARRAVSPGTMSGKSGKSEVFFT